MASGRVKTITLVVRPVLVAVAISAKGIVVLPITTSAVATKVIPEAVKISILVEATFVFSCGLNVPVFKTLFAAVFTFPSTTVVGVPPKSITSSTPLTNVTPKAADIIILVVAPSSAVLRVPVDPPCVTVTPALSVMSCDAIAKVHSFCETVTPAFSEIFREVIDKAHLF